MGKSLRIGIILLFFGGGLDAQNRSLNASLKDGMEYRLVGPHRGGRVTAVCGVNDELHTFYMGSTGGGVWKTKDAGTTWNNISDKYFAAGSVGAVEVSQYDKNVIFVGMGSACPRGNVSIGNGMYKSEDAGASWKHMGLDKSGSIGKIQIHPRNVDLAYAAVLGNPFGPNRERGVYRTSDGGKNWEQVLFVNDSTGAVDLAMDPNNPRILYACMWTAERKPWTMIDGSPHGGVWKSTDGGDSWQKVKGLPQGVVGRSGVAISPANSSRIWVIIEHVDEKKGGLYRSDDSGKSWKRINRSHNLRQRAWYYNHITADPQDENTVYIMNVRFHQSIDGGKNFRMISTPHGDNHALWINPKHPNIMIEGNDGGACVTLTGGQTWSSIYNQPTAEFYRLTVDDQYPYRLYGAQQDNSTISVPSRFDKTIDPRQNWYAIGGGESGHIAVHPQDPNIIYAGTYIGTITRKNLSTGHQRNIVAYPEMHDGTAPRDIKYRYQWNAPIRISPHNPDVVYHCSQYVHRSDDGGQTWETISGDLTTNKDQYQDIPGGPVQHDHTGVELYTTIFAFEESPQEAGYLWVGTDDGRVHLSKNDGADWVEITPPNMPLEGTVNMIELSPHDPGRAFIAVFKYRQNDFRPYIFRTDDYGQNWTSLSHSNNGIPDDHFVRVVREDPERKGLLYAGTEFGMFVSQNDGATWDTLQLNLPRTPITDMAVHQGDLVVATQGRSFWILDDLTPLREWNATIAEKGLHVFSSRTATRNQLRNFRGDVVPDRAPVGGIVQFFLKDKPDSSKVFKMYLKDESGTVRRTISNKGKIDKIKLRQGLNRYAWDLKLEKPKVEKKAVFSLANTGGVKAPPGEYTFSLLLGKERDSTMMVVKPDPRWEQNADDLKAQYDLATKAKNKLEQCHRVIGDLRAVRNQLKSIQKRAAIKSIDSLPDQLKNLASNIDTLEKELIQTKNESGQDPINFPSMIDDQIAYLYSVVNGQDDRPTEGTYQRFEDVSAELQPILDRWEDLKTIINEINTDLKDLPIIVIEKKTSKP